MRLLENVVRNAKDRHFQYFVLICIFMLEVKKECVRRRVEGIKEFGCEINRTRQGLKDPYVLSLLVFLLYFFSFFFPN